MLLKLVNETVDGSCGFWARLFGSEWRTSQSAVLKINSNVKHSDGGGRWRKMKFLSIDISSKQRIVLEISKEVLKKGL